MWCVCQLQSRVDTPQCAKLSEIEHFGVGSLITGTSYIRGNLAGPDPERSRRVSYEPPFSPGDVTNSSLAPGLRSNSRQTTNSQ